MSSAKEAVDIEDYKDVLSTKDMAELFGQTVGAFNTAKSRKLEYIPPKSFSIGNSPRWLKSEVLRHLEKLSKPKRKTGSGRKRETPVIRVT